MRPRLIPLDVTRNGTDLYASTSLSPINQPIKHIHLRRNGPNALDGNNPTGRSLIVRRASEITPEPIEWLWPKRVAIGKQTMIVGEPGLGKSQLTAFMAAAVTTAGQWPCNEGQAPLGSVIILSAEDDAADTIRPRLDAAGADPTRILIVSAVRSDDGTGRRTFNLQADLDLLEEEITKARDVRLVIIDPISSYLGKADSHKNSDVRGVLEPVGEMAARLRVAVVSVTHRSKGKGNSAINTAIGSVGFTGVARTLSWWRRILTIPTGAYSFKSRTTLPKTQAALRSGSVSSFCQVTSLGHQSSGIASAFRAPLTKSLPQTKMRVTDQPKQRPRISFEIFSGMGLA
jgi:hypothetical protein